MKKNLGTIHSPAAEPTSYSTIQSSADSYVTLVDRVPFTEVGNAEEEFFWKCYSGN